MPASSVMRAACSPECPKGWGREGRAHHASHASRPGNLGCRAGAFAESPLLRQRHRLLSGVAEGLQLELQLLELRASVGDQGHDVRTLSGSAGVECHAEALVHRVQRDLGVLDGRHEGGLRPDHLVTEPGERGRHEAKRGVDAPAPVIQARNPRLLTGTTEQLRSPHQAAACASGAGPTGARGCGSCSRHGAREKRRVTEPPFRPKTRTEAPLPCGNSFVHT